MSTVLQGVVRGRTIELDQEPGLPDGATVTVTLQPGSADKQHVPGEGLRKAFGAWAEDADDLDEFLEWNRQQRKVSRPELEP